MSENATELVFGLDVLPLDEGYIPLDALCIVKALDADGDPTLVIRHAGTISDWERIGMLTAALDIAKEQTTSTWVADSPDDEDDEDDTE